MKSGRILFVAAIAAAALTQAQSGRSASIVGSKHDMSNATWNTSKTLCGTCHIAHGAITGQPALWTHKLSTAIYTVYSAPTMNATVGQPGTHSKLCLSCHDGTVALENFGGVTTGTNFVLPVDNTGTDLSNDHPIGITYDTALSTADPGLYDPATKAWGGTPAGTVATAMLFSGKMECASCHDVHDPQYGYFLRKSNTGSALCLTCHNK
jgi:predicted CXXCH cytochrome family protein